MVFYRSRTWEFTVIEYPIFAAATYIPLSDVVAAEERPSIGGNTEE
jgi:hypothetical protein